MRIAYGLAMLAVLPGCLTPSGARAEAPKSGYIQTVTYGVNKEGKPVGQRRTERLWFSNRNTRRDSLIGDSLATSMATGDTFWTAAPSAGRLLVSARPDGAARSVPETTRQSFEKFSAAHPKFVNAVWNGHACWKFSWHESALKSGDIGGDAYDVTEWVLADRDFPFVLRWETSFGGRSEVIDFQLNCVVPKSRFQQPAELAPVTGVIMPKAAFKIAVETDRTSLKYGWKNQAREVFTGDGKQVTVEYRSTQTESNGRSVPFDAPRRKLSYEMAKAEITKRLQNPQWFAMKKTQQDTALGLPADVLVGTVAGLPDEKWWVVNHPVLGTISVRRESKTAEEQETMRVTEITVR